FMIATSAKPRYDSPQPLARRNSSVSWRASALLSGLERSSDLANSPAATRMRSRNSRVSGTTFRWAVLADLGVVFSLVAVTVSPCRTLAARATQRRHGEDYGIQAFEIPQFGEIKADRGGIHESTGFDGGDEPGEAALDGGCIGG